MSASVVFWRPVKLSGFFRSANRAPLRSLAAATSPALRAGFQTSRRITSRGSLWRAARRGTGRRSEPCRGAVRRSGPAIQAAMSQETNVISLQRSLLVEEGFHGLAVTARGGPDQPAAVVIDDHRQVAVALDARPRRSRSAPGRRADRPPAGAWRRRERRSRHPCATPRASARFSAPGRQFSFDSVPAPYLHCRSRDSPSRREREGRWRRAAVTARMPRTKRFNAGFG